MKYYRQRRLFNYRFDFEIGFLVQSPCRECDKREDLPECSETCTTLDKIHAMLSHSVSCAKAC